MSLAQLPIKLYMFNSAQTSDNNARQTLKFMCRAGSGDNKNTTESGHSVSYKNACAPNEDSDQTAHQRSLI